MDLPPLRDRIGDLALLAQRFLGKGQYISKPALQTCMAYAWPGNVRELKHVLQEARVRAGGEVILPEHLPEELTEAPKAGGPESSTAG